MPCNSLTYFDGSCNLCPTVHSQFTKQIYLHDFVDCVKDMLDDSGYKLSEEYEVKIMIVCYTLGLV